jgi:hypothetical protein
MTNGIPLLPDLTHPQELLQFGQQLLQLSQWLILVLIGFGVVIAVMNGLYRGDRPLSHSPSDGPSDSSADERDRPSWLNAEMVRYSQILHGIRHGLLLVTILVGGFFLCSTLANRYHHWEQNKISQVASSVAGERVEHLSPQLRYIVEEPYTAVTYIDGRPTEVERVQEVSYFLFPSASEAEVTLTQVTDPATQRLIYQSVFSGTYEMTNTLNRRETFTFEAPPPIGYTLLQDYRVERDGERLEPQNQGDYRFPLRLRVGESTQFRISYRAQGAPRWVYNNANGQLLSAFRLTVLADFPNADFASGIVPTEITEEGQGTRFT